MMEGEKLKKPKAMEVSVEAKELSPMEAKDKMVEAMGEAKEGQPVEIEMEASEDEEEDMGGESAMMQKIMAMRKAKKEKMG